jgi:hypothetical protein
MSGSLTTGKLVLTNTQTNQDAFDRLRVSNPETLFELKATIGKLPFLVDEIVSGAGATSNAILANSYIQMGVTGAAGATGKVIRQTYEYIPYQPGKSKLMIFSAVMEAQSGGIAGVISRIGCFDSVEEKTTTNKSGNGCFFELNGTTLYSVIRLNDVDNKVAQSAWNYDKFDGSGPSGLTITDFSKARILAIDQEWLGVGRVRFGFFINGYFHLGHSYNHFGDSAITMPYTKTAKLPVRHEISSTTGTYAEMRMICSTVLSEGGYEPTGPSFSIGQRTGISVGSTLVPIISIKLREDEPYNRKSLILKSMSVLNPSATRGTQWDLYIFPSQSNILGGAWNNVDTTNSNAQYNNTATGISGLSTGVIVDSGYTDLSSNAVYNFAKYLSSPLVNSSITGTSKVLCLAAVRVSTGGPNPTINGALSWIEIE